MWVHVLVDIPCQCCCGGGTAMKWYYRGAVPCNVPFSHFFLYSVIWKVELTDSVILYCSQGIRKTGSLQVTYDIMAVRKICLCQWAVDISDASVHSASGKRVDTRRVHYQSPFGPRISRYCNCISEFAFLRAYHETFLQKTFLSCTKCLAGSFFHSGSLSTLRCYIRIVSL